MEVCCFFGEIIYVVEVNLIDLDLVVCLSSMVESNLGLGNLIVVREVKILLNEVKSVV